MGIANLSIVLAYGKKTIDTLESTKNQRKTARLLRLTFDQVHGVMLRAVERGLKRRDKDKVYEHICLDEKSIRRGHEFVSIMYDGDTGTVIDLAADRKDKSVENLCTTALSEEQRSNVKTVCTDMWDPFIKGARKYFPNATHCHDLYHCVTYLNEAVDKVRKREVRNCAPLRKTKYIWLKDQSRYSQHDWDRFRKLEEMDYQVSQAWKIKEVFRDLIRLDYYGDMDAYCMLAEWMNDALSYNIDEINAVVFMFKRHLKGIIRALVTGANNGRAERMNGSIQEIKTIGRGYGNAERYRTAILFFYGGLDKS